MHLEEEKYEVKKIRILYGLYFLYHILYSRLGLISTWADTNPKHAKMISVLMMKNFVKLLVFKLKGPNYSLCQLLTFNHAVGSSELLNLPFLCQLRNERFLYLKKKPYYPLFERSFEIGRIFAMESSR